MSDVLVLNSTYEPLNVTSIARAVRLIFAGKAEVLHDRGRIASPTIEFPLPSIVRMLYFIRHRKKRVALTKKNVLLRDDYTCGYCNKRGDRSTMTIDHVIPRRQGGRSEWGNLVAACVECNGRKRDRTPLQAQMPLRRKPHEPRFHTVCYRSPQYRTRRVDQVPHALLGIDRRAREVRKAPRFGEPSGRGTALISPTAWGL